MASIGAVIVKCPVCDEEMPPIRLVLEEQALVVPVNRPGRKTSLDLVIAPELDDVWYDQARVEHGDCMQES